MAPSQMMVIYYFNFIHLIWNKTWNNVFDIQYSNQRFQYSFIDRNLIGPILVLEYSYLFFSMIQTFLFLDNQNYCNWLKIEVGGLLTIVIKSIICLITKTFIICKIKWEKKPFKIAWPVLMINLCSSRIWLNSTCQK